MLHFMKHTSQSVVQSEREAETEGCSAVGISDLTGEGAKVIERKTSGLSMLYLALLGEM